MLRLVQFYGRARGASGRVLGLPAWARGVLFVAALPGAVLIGLSILAFAVSVLALLALTLPVYALLRAVMPAGVASEGDDSNSGPSPGRKRVEASVVE